MSPADRPEALARADAAEAPADAALLDALRQQLVEISEGKLQAAEIDAEGHLFDCGYVDSLSAVMFLAHLEERYGVRIEDVELVETYTTLEAIARHVQQSRGA